MQSLRCAAEVQLRCAAEVRLFGDSDEVVRIGAQMITGEGKVVMPVDDQERAMALPSSMPSAQPTGGE